MSTMWIRVTKKNPCPVCAHGDWCSVSGDLVHCMRVESIKPCKSAKVGGWFHKVSEPIAYVPPPKPKHKPVAQADFAPLAEKYYVELFRFANEEEWEDGNPTLQFVSKDLGLSMASLKSLGAGWDGKCVTFPMKDGNGHIIGIRVRGTKAKWCVPGSHNGLFWPGRVSATGKSVLLLPEGPTSCGACLDLDYDAIGRPNCELGLEDLRIVLRQSRRDVVIVADHDKAHKRPDGSVYFPGRDGAQKIAAGLKSVCGTLKIVELPRWKDPRDFLRAGGTRAMFDCFIKSRKFL